MVSVSVDAAILVATATANATATIPCTTADWPYDAAKTALALNAFAWVLGTSGAIKAFDCDFPSERRTAIGFMFVTIAVSAVSGGAIAAYAVHVCLHSTSFSSASRVYACVDCAMQAMLWIIIARFACCITERG